MWITAHCLLTTAHLRGVEPGGAAEELGEQGLRGEAAAYSSNANFPVVNMTGGEVTNIFGGGKGNTAIVTGNPQVTLSGTALVNGNVYGGGNAAKVTGNTSVIIKD